MNKITLFLNVGRIVAYLALVAVTAVLFSRINKKIQKQIADTDSFESYLQLSAAILTLLYFIPFLTALCLADTVSVHDAYLYPEGFKMIFLKFFAFLLCRDLALLAIAYVIAFAFRRIGSNYSYILPKKVPAALPYFLIIPANLIGFIGNNNSINFGGFTRGYLFLFFIAFFNIAMLGVLYAFYFPKPIERSRNFLLCILCLQTHLFVVNLSKANLVLFDPFREYDYETMSVDTKTKVNLPPFVKIGDVQASSVYLSKDLFSLFLQASLVDKPSFVDGRYENYTEEHYRFVCLVLSIGYSDSFNLINPSKAKSLEEAKEIYRECLGKYQSAVFSAMNLIASKRFESESLKRNKIFIDQKMRKYSYKFSVDGVSIMDTFKTSALTDMDKDVVDVILNMPHQEVSLKDNPLVIKGLNATKNEIIVTLQDNSEKIPLEVDIFNISLYSMPALQNPKEGGKELDEIYNKKFLALSELSAKKDGDESILADMSKVKTDGVKMVNLKRYSLVNKLEQNYFPFNLSSKKSQFESLFIFRPQVESSLANNIYNCRDTYFTAPVQSENCIYIAKLEYVGSELDDEFVKKYMIEQFQVDNRDMIEQTFNDVMRSRGYYDIGKA